MMVRKPSLHEIAAMPHSAGVRAMREHYDPRWGKDTGDGVKKTFRCSVDYEICATEVVDIEAFTKEEAQELAAEKVGKALEADHGLNVEIDHVDAREIDQ